MKDIIINIFLSLLTIYGFIDDIKINETTIREFRNNSFIINFIVIFWDYGTHDICNRIIKRGYRII